MYLLGYSIKKSEVLLISIIIALIITLIVIFTYPDEGWGYRVFLKDEKIVEGEELVLYFDFVNTYDFPLEDVKFRYYPPYGGKVETREISLVPDRSWFRGNTTLSLGDYELGAGVYRIHTTIEFVNPNDNELESKSTSLSFEIYEED